MFCELYLALLKFIYGFGIVWYSVHGSDHVNDLPAGPGSTVVSCPDPTSKEEKGLVNLGRILGPALRI